MLKYQFALLRQRLLPNAIVTHALTLLDDCDQLFEDELMWDEVKYRVHAALVMASAKMKILLAEPLKAERVIFEIIARIATRKIAYGNEHVYRGVLGIKGVSYRAIAEQALLWLHESEWHDTDRYGFELDRIAGLVKEAG